jgi:DNA repair protein RecO (recombination protein O)
MPTYKAKAVVLNTFKLGEADKIIVLFSGSRGKIRAVAKGVRKTKSKFGSSVEPFTVADMMFYEGKSLDIIQQSEIIMSFKEIRADLEKLKYGSVMLELIDKVGQEREESYDAFSLLLAALQCLKDAPDNYRTLLTVFQLKLMVILGYRPHLARCPACAGSLPDAAAQANFSLKFGGLLCDGCLGRDQEAMAVSPETRAHIGQALDTPLARWRELDFTAENVKGIARLTEMFVSYHLERKLKSPRLLDM